MKLNVIIPIFKSFFYSFQQLKDFVIVVLQILFWPYVFEISVGERISFFEWVLQAFQSFLISLPDDLCVSTIKIFCGLEKVGTTVSWPCMNIGGVIWVVGIVVKVSISAIPTMQGGIWTGTAHAWLGCGWSVVVRERWKGWVLVQCAKTIIVEILSLALSSEVSIHFYFPSCWG